MPWSKARLREPHKTAASVSASGGGGFDQQLAGRGLAAVDRDRIAGGVVHNLGVELLSSGGAVIFKPGEGVLGHDGVDGEFPDVALEDGDRDG